MAKNWYNGGSYGGKARESASCSTETIMVRLPQGGLTDIGCDRKGDKDGRAGKQGGEAAGAAVAGSFAFAVWANAEQRGLRGVGGKYDGGAEFVKCRRGVFPGSRREGTDGCAFGEVSGNAGGCPCAFDKYAGCGGGGACPGGTGDGGPCPVGQMAAGGLFGDYGICKCEAPRGGTSARRKPGAGICRCVRGRA